MEVVKYEMDVPKEFKEVVDFLEGVAKLAMEKKWGEIAGLIPAGMQAVDGYEDALKVVNSQYRDESVAYLSKKMTEVVLPYKGE